jgi:hypothetical protein
MLMGGTPMRLKLKDIILDEDAQIRVEYNEEALINYRCLYDDNIDMGKLYAAKGPNGEYWLFDGFHRFRILSFTKHQWVNEGKTVRGLGRTEADFLVWEVNDVYQARAMAFAAVSRSIPYASGDKTRMVVLAMRNPKFAGMNGRQLAAAIGVVTPQHINAVRRDMEAGIDPLNKGAKPRGRAAEAYGSGKNGDAQGGDAKTDDGPYNRAAEIESTFDSPAPDKGGLPEHLRDIFADPHIKNAAANIRDTFDKAMAASRVFDPRRHIGELSKRLASYHWLKRVAVSDAKRPRSGFAVVEECLLNAEAALTAIDNNLSQALGVLKNCTPHAACPNCKGLKAGEECGVCDGCGYVPEWILSGDNHLIGPEAA